MFTIFKKYLFFYLPVLSLSGGGQASLAVTLRPSSAAVRGILVPGPGTEPASPALQGGLLTTGPPGKP